MTAQPRSSFATRPPGVYDLVVALFCALLLISNVAAVKLIQLGPEFTVGGFPLLPLITDGGALLFPLTYVLGDVLAEVYGMRGARRAIFLGFVGVLIIIRPGSGVFTWASLLPLCTAISTACYQVLTRRIAHRESVYTSIFYPGFGGMLIFGLLLPFSWTLPQSALHVVLLVLVGVIGTSSHLILIKAFDHASASRLAPFTYSQMIWATVMGYFVFGNFPDFWSLAGIAILAACGIYLVTHLRQSNG